MNIMISFFSDGLKSIPLTDIKLFHDLILPFNDHDIPSYLLSRD
jgi:hypothetical protein